MRILRSMYECVFFLPLFLFSFPYRPPPPPSPIRDSPGIDVGRVFESFTGGLSCLLFVGIGSRGVVASQVKGAGVVLGSRIRLP